METIKYHALQISRLTKKALSLDNEKKNCFFFCIVLT